MTKFTKESLTVHGGYMSYHDENGSRFVARFKYSASGTFKTFLIKNFTVEEYFAKLDAGFAPLTILEAKGFVNHNVRKAMRADGLKSFTTETYRAWFAERMKRQHGTDCTEFFAKQDEEFAAINAIAA